MKSILFALIFVLAQSAQAHFQLGRYNGVFETGEACSFEIKSVSFKNNLHHPLNEVVVIDVDFSNLQDVEFTHLGQVDLEKITVRPKPEVLTAIFANATGAQAFEMVMNDDGPEKMVLVEDHYKSREKSSRLICGSLVYEK